ncbi:MAG: GNAT family N-acetyltransferase [Chlamydiia bacterium]|nr:GNAT family N-acetyltransferase [Chlamydiia bacterium]
MKYFLDLAKTEGWNPGLHDALPFYRTDPQGFFVAELEGKKVGCISAVTYGEKYGFMGFFIVEKAYRRQGIGSVLWERALDHLGQRSIGLDGVIAQQESYQRSSFVLYHRNFRFEGVGKGVVSDWLIDLKSVPFATVEEYDEKVFGVNRKVFLQEWIHMPEAQAYGCLNKGALCGYGVVRRCHKGYKIGPLFADNEAAAQLLFSGLGASAKGEPLFFDVPETNPHALEIASNEKMKKVFETARMYNHPPPLQRKESVYGVTSFELG